MFAARVFSSLFCLILITFIYETGRTYNFRSPAPTAPMNYVKRRKQKTSQGKKYKKQQNGKTNSAVAALPVKSKKMKIKKMKSAQVKIANEKRIKKKIRRRTGKKVYTVRNVKTSKRMQIKVKIKEREVHHQEVGDKVRFTQKKINNKLQRAFDLNGDSMTLFL